MIQGYGKPLDSEKGLTLVEVLVAAVILGIAVISFSYMFGTAGADVIKLGNQRVCLHVARQEMEGLLELPYDAAALTVGRHYRRFKGPPADNGLDLEGHLFVQWQITSVDDPYGTGQDYKTIVLELYDDLLDEDPGWQGTDPAVQPVERVVTLTTIMAP